MKEIGAGQKVEHNARCVLDLQSSRSLLLHDIYSLVINKNHSKFEDLSTNKGVIIVGQDVYGRTDGQMDMVKAVPLQLRCEGYKKPALTKECHK